MALAAATRKLRFGMNAVVMDRAVVGAESIVGAIERTLAERTLRTKDLARVNVDTTVQPKNVTFPTDAKLLHAAILGLNRLAQKHGFLRSSEVAADVSGAASYTIQVDVHLFANSSGGGTGRSFGVFLNNVDLRRDGYDNYYYYRYYSGYGQEGSKNQNVGAGTP